MSFFEGMDASTFTDVEQSIYSYIVNNIELVPYMRVRDIAENTHTSSTSVFRFIKKLGYESFSEFRFAFKNRIIAGTLEENDGDSFINSYFNQFSRENFDRKLEGKVKQLSISIRNIDRIFIFGLGSSGIMADYLARRLINIGMDAIAQSDPTYILSSHLHINMNHLVIILSASGNTKETIEVMTGLEGRNNIEMWAIIGDQSSKIAQRSDYYISYSTQFIRKNVHADMTSQIPALFIMEAVINEVDRLGT